MDWFHDCFASIDSRTRIVKFCFSNKTILELKVGSSIYRGHVISCIKAYKMISIECLYHIVRVKDLFSEIPPIKLVPVVREFQEVFLDDLSSIPPQ